jgi:serine/threonine-protein kinase
VTARLGAYEILRELKSGGMGAVLLGRRRGPGAFEQLVALKTILPAYAGAPAVRAMFLDEAAILARVSHPGIAAVHDFGEEGGGEAGGALYLAMEYVAGIPFRALGELEVPPAVAARAVAEACRGLHAAHEVRDPAGALLGVVHRDISPDNLMLGFDGHVKVIDFGIALVRNRQAPVTELGMLKGKPPYMSPEQVKNEAIDRRSDVFSLGAVLHELLAGQPLFQGDSIYAVARAVEHQPIPPPSQVLGRPLPRGLDEAVLGALERELGRRTPTAAALAEALERVSRDAGGETLAAWAERALAGPREAHRRWLAEVLGGRDAPRPAVGRSTGAVTQLPSDYGAALAATALPVLPRAASGAEAAEPGPPDVAADGPPLRTPVPEGHTAPPRWAPIPEAHTAAPGAAGEPAIALSGERTVPPLVADGAAGRTEPPPRRRVVTLLLALLLLLGVAGGLLLLLRDRRAAPAPALADAAVAAAPDAAPASPEYDAAPAALPPDVAVAAARGDAAFASSPPPDRPLADAAVPRPRPRLDAGTGGAPLATAVRDAAVPAVPADATAAPPPTGTGRISIVGRGEAFLNILVDGRPFQVTPQLAKPIAAGKHAIVLLDPKTNQVVYETTVTIEPGQHVRVQPP